MEAKLWQHQPKIERTSDREGGRLGKFVNKDSRGSPAVEIASDQRRRHWSAKLLPSIMCYFAGFIPKKLVALFRHKSSLRVARR